MDLRVLYLPDNLSEESLNVSHNSPYKDCICVVCLQKERSHKDVETLYKMFGIKVLLIRSSQIRKFVLTSLPLPNLKQQQHQEDFTHFLL